MAPLYFYLAEPEPQSLLEPLSVPVAAANYLNAVCSRTVIVKVCLRWQHRGSSADPLVAVSFWFTATAIDYQMEYFDNWVACTLLLLAVHV